MMMDPVMLAKITPGVSELKEIEADHYKAIVKIKIGPVNGSFHGEVWVTEKVEPNSFKLKIDQKSKIGNADVNVDLNLTEETPNQTRLSFDGKVKISGLLANKGQRVLGGVANTITKQFFKNLKEQVAAQTNTNTES